MKKPTLTCYPKQMHLLITSQLMLKMIPLLEGEPLSDIQQIHSVSQLLLNLKPYRAAGPDNLPSYFLKEAANGIAPSSFSDLT